jgi:hypothetical protein
MTVKNAWSRFAALAAIALASSTAFGDEQHNTVVLTWDVPTVNEDGSPLTDLVAYYVYVGDSPTTMLPVYYTTADHTGIVMGYWGPRSRYYAVSAVNADGIESQLTGVLSDIQALP